MAGLHPLIAVIGGRSVSPEDYEQARALGRCIIEAGCGVVCGGAAGVMEAVCRGAAEAKSAGADPRPPIIGILQGTRADEGNRWVEVAIPTGMGVGRNVLVVLAGMGAIAVGGGAGTLSEIAYAWQLGRPVAALAGTGGWSARLAGEQLDPTRGDTVFAASTPESAVAYIVAAIES